MDYLVNTVGPRPYGSPANLKAANYLAQQLAMIKNATGNRIQVYVDQQPGYVLNPENDRLMLWTAMQNVVVKIAGDGTAPNSKALLLSAHYDTVTMSPGATDNTMGVSCMLEVVNVMAHLPVAKRDVYFVFVNGEESGLLGAWHFMKWDANFANVGAFINIDGTPGDKSMLFRTSGGFLDYSYMAVPRPLGFVVAQDIFNLGIVSSDTDWSVYKTSIPGLDMATFSHRQIYHTMKDTTIKPGAPQFLGDNILAIVKHILNSNEDIPAQKPGGASHVYFSFLNSGFAVYPMHVSLILHIVFASVLCALLIAIMIHRTIRWKRSIFAAAPPFRTLGLGFVVALLSLIASVGVGALTSFIAYKIGMWFAWPNAAMAVWAFVFPCLSAFLLIQWLTVFIETRFKIVTEVSRNHVFWGHAALACVLMFATIPLTAKNVGSTYLIYTILSPIIIQLIVQHIFYLLGFMSDDKSDYIPFANEESMSLLTGNAMGYGKSRSVLSEEHHRQTHKPKADSKTTHFMWFVIFVLGAVPVIFLGDLLPVLFEFASGALDAMIYGPVIGIVVYLFAINLMPVARRGGHLGFLTAVTFIIGLVLFFTFVGVNRTHFTSENPYVTIPKSQDGELKLRALETYAEDLRAAWNDLTSVVGNSGFFITGCSTKYSCSFTPSNITVATSLKSVHTGVPNQYSLSVSAPGAPWLSFNFYTDLFTNVSLIQNNVATYWNVTNPLGAQAGGTDVMILDPTNPYQLNFNSLQNPSGPWLVAWPDPTVLQGFDTLMQNIAKSIKFTFMGTGHGIHQVFSSVTFT